MVDQFNIPCHGCRHQTDLLPLNCPHGCILPIPDDWMYEPSDCFGYEIIAAGISIEESLGIKLFD